jgi:hypothetical protein
MKAEIKAEHERLRPILFEGAPPDAEYFYMSSAGRWCYMSESRPRPDEHYGIWESVITCVGYCKNQPETTLNWRDTLIRRKQ